MVNKKFSDFTSTSTLDSGEYIATELFGVENRKITFNNILSQIQGELLKLSYSDIGQIKSMILPHNNGIPILSQQNLVLMDGSIRYASDSNPLIGKFIQYCSDKPSLKTTFNIPADNSSMTLPDLRDKHLVGAGAGNPIYTMIASKSINFIQSIGTTITNSAVLTSSSNGDHYHIVNSWEENQDGGTTGGNYGGRGYYRNKAYTNPYRTQNAGSHTHTTPAHNHTATTTPVYNTGLIDSVNRVPAFAIFWVLDISVDRFTLDPNASEGIITIDMNQVNGLEDALNSKADLTALNNYATINALNLGLNSKANINHTHIIDNITGLQDELDGKANVSHTHLIVDLKYDSGTSLESWLGLTYAPIAHTHSISAITGLQTALDGKAPIAHIHTISDITGLQTALNSKSDRFKRLYYRKLSTTTAGTIAGNATIRLFDLAGMIFATGTQYDSNYNVSGAPRVITETYPSFNSINYRNKSLLIEIRISNGTANMGQTSVNPRLIRASDNTRVNGSTETIVNNGLDINMLLRTFSYGATDPFATGGYYLELRNTTGTALNYSTIEIGWTIIVDEE